MSNKEKFTITVPTPHPHKRHGGPYDRGSADRYYRRGFHPHYYVGATYSTDRVEKEAMTAEEIELYKRGYEEELGEKDWGDPVRFGDDNEDGDDE